MKMPRHSRLLLISILALGESWIVQGQPAVDATEAKVDGVFTRRIQSDGPGAVCAVMKNGQLLYAKGFGMADLEHNEPLSPDSVFYIASTSKQFTAAGIAMLVLDGKLSLATDIRTLLPEFTRLRKPVTVDQLLHHTSGVRDYFELLALTGWRDDDYFNNDMVVKLLSRQRELNFEPGVEFLYSNSNYVLLAEIVKRVSGKSLRSWDEERVFRPLEMTHTHFDDDYRQIVPHRVISYLPNKAGGYYQLLKEFDGYGDGNLLTTVGDLAKWDENFYTGRVGGKAFLELMLTHGVLNNGKPIDYALGLEHGKYRGLTTVRHAGGFKGFRTELVRFPDQHFSVTVLCNLGSLNAVDLANKVADIYLADAFTETARPAGGPAMNTPQVVRVVPTVFDNYVGEYELAERPGFILSVTRDGDHFYSQATGQSRIEIFASSDSDFFLKVVDAQLSFHRDADGTVSRLTLHQHGDHEATRIRRTSVPVAALTDYAGNYYSDELDTSYRLQVEDGKLVAIHARLPKISLDPRDRDVFEANTAHVVFSRDSNGNVTALRYTGGRVHNLEFRRQDPAP
jgi:CubicO group peptidase (beta-lactamase class C family)